MRFHDVVEAIEKVASPSWGESWDNSGIQINVGNDNIEHIMFCLEINDDVIDEAIEKSVDLIVTHHPLLFNRPDKIDVEDIVGRYVIKLIKAGISVYSAHITFDNAPLGNNYYLAKLIGLQHLKEVDDYIGVIGELPSEMKFKEVLSLVEESLNLPPHYIRAVGNDNMEIYKIAICTGAGGDILYPASNLDCQMVITGDVKLNVAQDAKAMGMALVDAGHYGTEKIFSENFKNQLKEILDEMGICDVLLEIACANTDPFSVW